MVGPFWEYWLLGTFYQNNGSPVKTKTLFVSNKASFCVRTCLAKPVRSYVNLLSLLTQPLTIMKWKSKIKTKSNQPMPADINKSARSGPWLCAESGCYWILKTKVDSNFGCLKCSRLLLFNPFCFGCQNGFFRPNSLRGQISRENGSLAHREYCSCCNYAIQVVAYAPGMQKLTLFVGAF